MLIELANRALLFDNQIALPCKAERGRRMKWYRSKHTGNYFTYHGHRVEKISARKWRAGIEIDNRKGRWKTRDFPTLGAAKKWAEKMPPRRRRANALQELNQELSRIFFGN